MYERIVKNAKKYFSKPKRSAGELSDKMHQLFQDNIADYDKFNNWYNENELLRITNGKAEHEHYVIENYKKSVFGDSYAIKEYKPFHS